MDKKRLTNELIAESFKNLILKKDFKKITVKMIASESGFMRSTFYNYFQDKYEILEWIVKTEIYDKIEPYVLKAKYFDAFKMVFKFIEDDKDFYKKAFLIDGQNGFEEILEKELVKLFKKAYENVDFNSDNKVVSVENISQYQALALIMYIKMWIFENRYGDAQYDEVCDAYILMQFRGGSVVTENKTAEHSNEKIWSAPIKIITDILGKKK